MSLAGDTGLCGGDSGPTGLIVPIRGDAREDEDSTELGLGG